ncbi:MAG: glycosyltransferase family 2 protein [Clostridia bacterium]|nr:glycosyltransferase family 2 protein [Clostridia bacterium]
MISVVLAAYKGEKYIVEQVKSIVSQLSAEDELVISDDFPQGETGTALKDIIDNDPRVKYIHGKGQGLIKNFEYAINNAKGDFIFLSDQDDVWLEGKVDAVMSEFEKGADVVMHDAVITDGDLNPIGKTAFELNSAGQGIFKNLLKNSYQGSCMAFRKEMKEYILPFPEKIPMHDQWIGLMGEKYGKVHLIDHPYILYRRHGENASGTGSSLVQKIKWRINMAGCLLRK